MAIFDYLPTYHQVEPNNLKGLQAGFVVAQMEIADSAKSTLAPKGMFENGHICAISADGIIEGTADSKALFIHYTEPLNTVVKGDKYFAVNTAEECGRLVQLIPGDEWMSDMEIPTGLESRIVEIKGTSGWYGVETLADGTAAKHYMFLG